MGMLLGAVEVSANATWDCAPLKCSKSRWEKRMVEFGRAA